MLTRRDAFFGLTLTLAAGAGGYAWAQPALGWALGLLATLLAIYGMVRLRRKLPARR